MKVIIAGPRNVDDLELVEKAVEKSGFKITTIYQGGANGIDRNAKEYALKYGKKHKEFPAKWNDIDAEGAIIKVNKWGKEYNVRAGFDRNEEMASKADALIALQPHGETSGTQDMIKRATEHGLKIYVYTEVDKIEDEGGEFYHF